MNEQTIIETIKKEVRHALRMSRPRSRYTLSQAAARLDVDKTGFWKRYVATGKLTAHKEDGKWYISDDSISEYIHSLELQTYGKVS